MTPAAADSAAAPRLASLSVFFPCHNEVDNVERLVLRTLEVMPGVADSFEVIIVDDGSTDGTGLLADRLAAEHPEVRAAHHATNQGYGGALQSGFAAATGEYVFFTDGDGQFDVAEISRLIALLGQADMALGWRIKRADSFIRIVNAKAYMLMIRLLFGLGVRDIDCAFKLVPRRVVQAIELRSKGALISAELLIKARHAGFTYAQTGVSHYPRLAGQQSGAKLSVILRMFRELWRLRQELGASPPART
jgi:glycosyltransferase involved in cell wall biosynthesis